MKGLGDLFAAIKPNALPADGGVFYVRGGYGNLDSLIPCSPRAAVKAAFQGNDSHPGYSDLEISEEPLAGSINAIASSKYWPESAIIITYDETEGLYDHTQPQIRHPSPLTRSSREATLGQFSTITGIWSTKIGPERTVLLFR